MQQSLRRPDPFQRTKEERRAARPDFENNSSTSSDGHGSPDADDEGDGQKLTSPPAARANQQSQWSWPKVLCLGLVVAICLCILSVAAYKQYLASSAQSQLALLSPQPLVAVSNTPAPSLAPHVSPSAAPPPPQQERASLAATALIESSGQALHKKLQKKVNNNSGKRHDSHKLKHKRNSRQVHHTLQTELNGNASSIDALRRTTSR